MIHVSLSAVRVLMPGVGDNPGTVPELPFEDDDFSFSKVIFSGCERSCDPVPGTFSKATGMPRWANNTPNHSDD